MSTTEYVVELENLVKVYKQGNVRALDGLDLKIKRGEIYAFIGANGTGKSTAIKIMNGILRPTEGSVKILGKHLPKERHEVAPFLGMAPQEYSVYLDLTVKENIEFFAKNYRMRKEDIHSVMEDLLDILNLKEKEDTLGRNLSGGMKRRLSLACALIHQPKLVFLDEATVGVDPILRQFFWDYFRRLRDFGVTLVITSHVMDEAEKADRIGLIRAGKLIAEGTPSELKQQYDCSTVEEVFIQLSGGVLID